MFNQGKTKKYYYQGVSHIHTILSDGTGTIDQISKAAQKAGLTWIIISDHNNIDFKEGFYNGVCVIKAEEISPKNKNHYLALNINELIEPNDNPQIYVDKTREQGGFGFVAHPHEATQRNNPYPPIIWTDETITPDGVEIWNWFSAWADKLNDRNIFNLAYSFFFKHNLISIPTKKTMEWWDQLNNNSTEIIPAICGVDAHALKIKKYIFPITVFSYKMMFNTLRNVIYLNEPLKEDFETQKQQILNALKNANNIILNSRISKKLPNIFINNEEDTATCGEKIKLNEKTYLNISTHKKATIKVFANGKEIYSCISKQCKLQIKELGKYRVEIIINNKGFAYSNPIIVD